MAADNSATGHLPRVVIVPRPLESFFLDRLERRYAGREDVTVVLDRRRCERRRVRAEQPAPEERRRADRRTGAAVWSLAEMPMRTGAG